MQNTLLEIMYIFGGIISVVTGLYALSDKENKKRFGTALFWIIFGTIFIIGPYVSPVVVGILLLIMGFLTLTSQVQVGKFKDSTEEHKERKSLEIGNTIFIPALTIGVVALLIATFTPLGGLIGLGIGALTALIISLIVTKEKPENVTYDSSRLLQQMGVAVILPQLLGSLGAIFSKAGVGDIISSIMSGFVPEGNYAFGVVIYCVSMAVFTIIMGNGFAAFAVITTGIGIPFVIMLGGNPAVVGALGLTAGYCGTLMTPMAANFNIVPASILEIKNKYNVIINQVPLAFIMLLIHIVLMYLLAF